MSHDAMKFVGLCLSGEALPAQIDDFVDLWHDGDSNESLSEFLGLTGEEYALWVEKPAALANILSARTGGLATGRPHALTDR